jgi:integration host factor subunit beta
MVKSELIQRIVELHPDLPGETCGVLVDAFFDAMADQLTRHGRIELRGFAAFSVAPPSVGTKQNPRTGEKVGAATLPRIRFRPSSVLATAIDRD